MLIFIRKLLAFIKRDFLIEISYKFSFFLQFGGILLALISFYFLSMLIGGENIKHLQPYGGNYFSFVIIGIAFSNYLSGALLKLSRHMRNEQVTGTLEALLSTQTGIHTIIFSASFYNFLFTSIRVFLYLFLGILLFSVNIGDANYFGGLLILILTILAFSGLGIISTSFIIVFKRGDPISWIFTTVSWLFGGVYYPISILPVWLQKLSYLLPITYSLEGMRMALLRGYSLRELSPQIFALLIFSLIIIPLSLSIFKYSIKKAKIMGTLSQY